MVFHFSSEEWDSGSSAQKHGCGVPQLSCSPGMVRVRALRRVAAPGRGRYPGELCGSEGVSGVRVAGLELQITVACGSSLATAGVVFRWKRVYAIRKQW